MTDPTPHSSDADERRSSNQDRRGASRSGKLDRRRNHCGSCAHFIHPSAPALPSEQGFCQHHRRPFAATDYACTAFAPKGG
ncbi:MAG: hypothetical protein QE263_02810 [Vampirovibrionales bacterium]|nr:hypothetical protein [Vampirovibrionales bacterium]